MSHYLNIAHQAVPDVVTHTCFVTDISISMGFVDWPPTRLHGAIEAANVFLDIKCRHYPNDQMALVSFAMQAYINHPLVQVAAGAASLRNALSRLSVLPCTNIEAGLNAGYQVLVRKPEQSAMTALRNLGRLVTQPFSKSQPALPPMKIRRQIVLLTDGVSAHAPPGSSVTAAHNIKHAGIEIDVIGIGGSRTEVNEVELKAVASVDDRGRPRYSFIGEKSLLIQEFKRLANHIEPL